LERWIWEGIINLGNISEVVDRDNVTKMYADSTVARAKLMTAELTKRASCPNYRASLLQAENYRLQKQLDWLERNTKDTKRNFPVRTSEEANQDRIQICDAEVYVATSTSAR